MMNTSFPAAALLAGALVGAVFYGGLWWSVRTLIAARRASFWLVGGFVIRTMLAIGGFWLVAQGGWRNLLACLAGFCAVRVCAAHFARWPTNAESGLAPGSRP